MKLQTEVELPKPQWTIRHSDKLLLLGSCFADNMGTHLVRAGFRAETNSFGTLYNPVSIAEIIARLLDNRDFQEEDILFFGAEGWGTWMSHSLLSRPTQEKSLQVHNERLAQARKQLHEARVLLVTFGTAWGYRLTGQQVNGSTGQQVNNIVANCHHEPAERFIRERITAEEIVRLWRPLLRRLRDELPQLHVLFTVSPIRHLREGAHANQLSKATLLLAVEELVKEAQNENEEWSYFPAYEIVLDELRDYRFYAEDMVHPSTLAIDYLWERFATTFFDASTCRSARRIEEITKALDHHPLHPESDEYRQFVRQTMLKIQDFQKEFPYFDAGKLLDRCHTLLNS